MSELELGDAAATNRMGIALLNQGRTADALAIFEAGLRLHPGNKIMARRAAEARRVIDERDAPARGFTDGAHWSDFEPEELVERGLAGPGRDASIRFCGASLLASEAINKDWTAVTPIKHGRRFRIIGGVFTGVAPYQDKLTVAVPVAQRALIAKVSELGGFAWEPAKAVPCVQLAVPRSAVEAVHEELFAAHHEHLRLSLAAGPPTHLRSHHQGLRRYLLEQAALQA